MGLSGGVSFGNLDTKVGDRGESTADRGATVTPSTSLPKPANLFGGTASGGPTAATASAMKPPSYAGVAHKPVKPMPEPEDLFKALGFERVEGQGGGFMQVGVNKLDGFDNSEVLIDATAVALAMLQ